MIGTLRRLLPEPLKARIRPAYHRAKSALAGPKRDQPSALALETFGEYEIAYRKRTADESVIGHSFENDIFLTGVPEYRPLAGHTVIDVGAHIGTFSLLASTAIGKGQVHSIEASLDSYNLLRINVALNGRSNIHTHHLALSGETGTTTLYHDVGNWGHSTVSALSSSSETVPATTLARFMDEQEIPSCDFIKLNCEGAEFPILLGSSESTLRRVAVMLVLYHCDLWTHHSEAALVSHLESSGFSCVVRNRSQLRGWIIATRNDQRLSV